MQVTDWKALLTRAEEIGIPSYDLLVRKAALHDTNLLKDPSVWIETAKGSPDDLSEEIDGVQEYWKRLAWGGPLLDQEALASAQDSCVGIEIDFARHNLWTLTAKGRLSRLTPEGSQDFQIEPAQSDYVDFALSPLSSELFLLENCGRLARFDGVSAQTLWQGICDPSRQGWRRLKVDPTNGEVWAMDHFGELYHSPSRGGWLKDSRFRKVSRRGELDVDVARDFCLSPNGTIAFLACDGEIWTSSEESADIHGPIRGTHYFPDYPAAQSIGWKEPGFQFVDRYGGFFHAPYPTRPSDLKYRGTYLFPRGVFVDEEEVQAGYGVVDHAFNNEKHWLYLLTSDGRLFTNFKGMGTEAD